MNNNLTELSQIIFENNLQVGWWTYEEKLLVSKDLETNKYTKETSTLIASKLALCHSELSEALEGMRKGLKDDHLPHLDMIDVELADTVIRILDLCGFLGIDIGRAFDEKFAYNQTRADHKMSNRTATGGKTI